MSLPSEDIPDAIGHQPGWCYFAGLVVIDGKLSITEDSIKHGSMVALGVSRFGETGHRFFSEAIGPLRIVLIIDFRSVESSDLGLIDIVISGDDHRIHPGRHQVLCGSHKHTVNEEPDADLDDGFKPNSFEDFIFFGLFDRKEFSIEFTSQTGSPDGIKADMMIDRLGIGKEFKDGIVDEE